MKTYMAFIIICLLFCLHSSAIDSSESFVTNTPADFKLVIKVKYLNDEITFDMNENTLSSTFAKAYKIRGEEIKGKVISANLKDEDKVLIYEYVLRNNMFSIKDKKLNSLGSIKRYPHDNTIFKIELNDNGVNSLFECDVENLRIYNGTLPNNDINKLWSLYEIVNLLLQLRCNETMRFDNWLIDYLKERITAVEKGQDKFENDFLSNSIINSELNILKKYKDLLRKQKESSVSEDELNTMKQLKGFLDSPAISKSADLPYLGMTPFQIKWTKEQKNLPQENNQKE